MPMNIELDKDDLFRNAVPGYVFLIVILSFYVTVGRLAETEPVNAILAIVAGFPLGFIIHYLYRFIHIHCPVFLRAGERRWSEQRRMEHFEAELIRKKLRAINIQNIESKLELEKDSRRQDRELSQLFELFLCKTSSSELRARSHFLIMRVHSLSGAMVAILLALCTVVVLKYPEPEWELWRKRYLFGWEHTVLNECNILLLFWIFIFALFWGLRWNANEAYQLSIKQMIVISWKGFCEFISVTNASSNKSMQQET